MRIRKLVIISFFCLALMVPLGTINAFGAADTIAPQVKITFPNSGSTLPAGQITVLGTAVDNAGGSGVKKVEVKIDGGAYKLATPQAPGDWSQWSILVMITTEGSHSIKARATDNAGKQRWHTITITINTQDNIPPAITAPANVSAEATGVTTLIPSLGTAAVSDNLDPSPAVTNNAPPSFSLGSTEITWTAMDDSGNSATDTQSVTVSDTTPPSIFAPPDILTASSGTLTPVDLGEPTVTDLVDLSLVVTNDAPQAGFPVGITTVTWTAIDDFGNSGTVTQTVTITDSAPSILAPSDIAKEATGSLTPVDLGYPIVTDNLDPSPAVTNNAPPVGFPVGTTIVTWTATDYSGSSATAMQTIIIVDTTPPSMISPADFTAEVVGGFTTVNLGTPTVIDIVDPLPTVTNNAPSEGFAPGTHTVIWTASDNYGNGASTTQTVTLTDNTPPSVVANPGGGTYSSPQSVILTANETSVEIYYTIDGSDPISTGFEFSTPLNVDVDTTLKFYAVDASGNIGGVSTQGYTINITDTTAPSILMTQPVAGSVLTVPDGQILVTGVAFDNGSGIDVVEVLIDSGSYWIATPMAPGDWSTWNITVPVTTGERRLVSRATDNAGNQNWNEIYVTITTDNSPPPPTGSSLDPFGIAMLYPTAAGIDNEYYTKTNASTTTEFVDNGKIQRMSGFSRNSDGTWNINGGPRWVITGGWRNVEMTMQLKINSGSQVQFYANGEEHTSNNDGAWHGSANKMRMYADGRIGFVKELYHESGNSGYSPTTAVQSSGTSILGKWVTVKYVGYNLNDNMTRKHEGYLDVDNNNNFVKISELVDNGNWNASSKFDQFMSHMRANYPTVVPQNRDTGEEMKRNEVITWEGGFVSFRCDSANYDFRNVSVREITAANGLIDPSVVQ